MKWQRLLPNSLLKELLAPIWDEVKHVWTRDIFADVFKRIRKPDLRPSDCTNYSLYLESKTFLHGLLVVEDKLSMAHGLETRVPFLDNDLVDFALKVPHHRKIVKEIRHVNENNLVEKIEANKRGKHLLRITLSRYLDKQIVDRKKQGFSSPDSSWFRGESIEYVKKELLNQEGIFNASIIKKIISEHASGTKNNRLAIWSLLYLRIFLNDQPF